MIQRKPSVTRAPFGAMPDGTDVFVYTLTNINGLELRAIRGVFVCGEMLDWEAPTGGYLLTGCWATGRWAGRAAAQRIMQA